MIEQMENALISGISIIQFFVCNYKYSSKLEGLCSLPNTIARENVNQMQLAEDSNKSLSTVKTTKARDHPGFYYQI